MTLYAPEGLPIVLLERFERQLNVSVTCRDDEGVLSLVFATEDAFAYAVRRWGFVNEADDGRFLLIANVDGCGVDGQRQAYVLVFLLLFLVGLMLTWSIASLTLRKMLSRSLHLWLHVWCLGLKSLARTSSTLAMPCQSHKLAASKEAFGETSGILATTFRT